MKPNLLHLTLHANDLSDDMFIGILEHVPGEILKELHFSKNKRLTIKSYEMLAQKLNSGSKNNFEVIEKLSLEENGLRDHMVEVLCVKGLSYCQTLE